MNQDAVEAELERARATYASRDADPRLADLYEPIRPAPLFTTQSREWGIARALRRDGLTSLRDLDILEVGCGSGVEMQRLQLLGADPTRMAGIDLMESRIAAARLRLPAADLRVGSAHILPFPSHRFDLVAQFMMFSSIVNQDVRLAAASEMLRVLRPGGRLLWYDIRTVRRPVPDIHPIDRREVATLFVGCDIVSRPSTLRWDVLSRILPLGRQLSLALEVVPMLNSHLIAVIRPSV
jgi:SAM-dependent methyltransferase